MFILNALLRCFVVLCAIEKAAMEFEYFCERKDYDIECVCLTLRV